MPSMQANEGPSRVETQSRVVALESALAAAQADLAAARREVEAANARAVKVQTDRATALDERNAAVVALAAAEGRERGLREALKSALHELRQWLLAPDRAGSLSRRAIIEAEAALATVPPAALASPVCARCGHRLHKRACREARESASLAEADRGDDQCDCLERVPPPPPAAGRAEALAGEVERLTEQRDKAHDIIVEWLEMGVELPPSLRPENMDTSGLDPARVRALIEKCLAEYEARSKADIAPRPARGAGEREGR